MSNSASPFVPSMGTFLITDGAALTFTLNYTDGDFNISGLSNSQKTKVSFRNRGHEYAVVDVEDAQIDFSFTAHATQILGDGATATLADVVLRKGPWIAAVSTITAAQGGSYAVQCKWTGERTDFGATADNSITLKYCVLTLDFAEGVPGKLSVKGIAHTLSTDFISYV